MEVVESARLHDELSTFKAKLDEWGMGVQKSLHNGLKVHHSSMRTFQDEFKGLHSKEVQSQQDAQKAAHRSIEFQQDISAKQHEMSSLKAQHAKAMDDVQLLRSCLETNKENYACQIKAASSRDSSEHVRKEELERAMHCYQNRLGLRFERTGDERLRLVFTQIDRVSPEREFSFRLLVDAQGSYQVEDCVPMVSGLADLQQQLNDTNNFSAFVVAMRKCFKAKCT